MKARTVRLWSVVHTRTSLISTVFLLLSVVIVTVFFLFSRKRS